MPWAGLRGRRSLDLGLDLGDALGPRGLDLGYGLVPRGLDLGRGLGPLCLGLRLGHPLAPHLPSGLVYHPSVCTIVALASACSCRR